VNDLLAVMFVWKVDYVTNLLFYVAVFYNTVYAVCMSVMLRSVNAVLC